MFWVYCRSISHDWKIPNLSTHFVGTQKPVFSIQCLLLLNNRFYLYCVTGLFLQQKNRYKYWKLIYWNHKKNSSCVTTAKTTSLLGRSQCALAILYQMSNRWLICMCFSTIFCARVWQALGGLSYQALYQRILSAASTTQAQITCYAAALPLFIMGIPSVTIAAAAASAGNLFCRILAFSWTRSENGKANTEKGIICFLCQNKWNKKPKYSPLSACLMKSVIQEASFCSLKHCPWPCAPVFLSSPSKTGIWQRTVCPPPSSVVRQQTSSPWPCSTWHPPGCQCWASVL